jgi:hypothetical protein
MCAVYRRIAFAAVALIAASTLDAQELRTVSFSDRDRPSVELFADANLKSLLAQNTGGNPQTAAGSLGLTYRTESVIAHLMVNAIGQADPVRRNFGATLLIPASGPSLSAGLADLAIRIGSAGSVCQAVAIHAYGSLGSAKWRTTPAGGAETEYGVVVGGAGGTLRCVMFSGALTGEGGGSSGEGENHVAAFLEVGPSFRTVGGEIANADNDAVRQSLLGTTEKGHWGVEATFGLEFNGVKAALTYYGFSNDVPGMNDGQVVAGFSVQTALFRGLLNRPRREPEYLPPRRRR